MKLYNAAQAPSPTMERNFMAEKGLSIPTVEIDTRRGENLATAFHPLKTAP
ncbi:MAG: hypothetical protein P8126_00525 [Gammaproteobacteria bacterium]